MVMNSPVETVKAYYSTLATCFHPLPELQLLFLACTFFFTLERHYSRAVAYCVYRFPQFSYYSSFTQICLPYLKFYSV